MYVINLAMITVLSLIDAHPLFLDVNQSSDLFYFSGDGI